MIIMLLIYVAYYFMLLTIIAQIRPNIGRCHQGKASATLIDARYFSSRQTLEKLPKSESIINEFILGISYDFWHYCRQILAFVIDFYDYFFNLWKIAFHHDLIFEFVPIK